MPSIHIQSSKSKSFEVSIYYQSNRTQLFPLDILYCQEFFFLLILASISWMYLKRLLKVFSTKILLNYLLVNEGFSKCCLNLAKSSSFGYGFWFSSHFHNLVTSYSSIFSFCFVNRHKKCELFLFKSIFTCPNRHLKVEKVKKEKKVFGGAALPLGACAWL